VGIDACGKPYKKYMDRLSIMSHLFQDKPHYHLVIQTIRVEFRKNEMTETVESHSEFREKFRDEFEYTDRHGETRIMPAATVADLVLEWEDRHSRPFCGEILWRNTRLDTRTELRNVCVAGQKLLLYHPDMDHPIQIKYVLPPSEK
jgi:hypothetical protein